MSQSQDLALMDMTNLYWAIGALIVMNGGTIIAIVIGAGRVLWWVSKLDSRVETNSKEINRAFKLIASK